MITALLACTPSPWHGQVVARVPVSEAAEVEALEALGDVWTEHVLDAVDVRLHARDLDLLPPGATLLGPDLEEAIDRSFSGGGAGFHEDWRPLDEIEGFLDELAARGPHARVEALGTSVEGRPILGLVIEPPGPADRVGLLVTATQHAREWVAASSALWVAERLVEGVGVDPEVTALLDRYRVVIVPVVNPDGYRHTWTTDRLWRKSRVPNRDGTFGVDLNRNWDAAFGGPGSAGAPSSGNYRGPSPFSEPETAAIRDLVEARPDLALHLDLHCTGQVVLSSWGFTADPAPDAEELLARGLDAELAMEAAHGELYRSGPMHEALYPASGLAIDWTYGVRGATSFLLELRDRGEYGFLLPPDRIEPTAEETWAGLLAVADGPVLRLGLEAPPLAAGQPATLLTSRSPADVPVEVWWSATGPGATPVPGGEVELEGARLLAEGVAGPDGAAEVPFDVPAAWAGATVWLQAWDGATRSHAVERAVP